MPSTSEQSISMTKKELTLIIQEVIYNQLEELKKELKDDIKSDISSLHLSISSSSAGIKQEIESLKTEHSYLKSNFSYFQARSELGGNLPETVERGPAGHGLLEPVSSWGRKRLYNR